MIPRNMSVELLVKTLMMHLQTQDPFTMKTHEQNSGRSLEITALQIPEQYKPSL